MLEESAVQVVPSRGPFILKTTPGQEIAGIRNMLSYGDISGASDLTSSPISLSSSIKGAVHTTPNWELEVASYATNHYGEKLIAIIEGAYLLINAVVLTASIPTVAALNYIPVFTLNGANVQDIYLDLQALQKEEAEEGFEITDYSIETVKRIIGDAYQMLQRNIPVPTVASDDEGGVRIEWKGSQREVRLVVRRDSIKKSYIYYRSGDHSDIDSELSGRILAYRLQSVIGT